MKKTTILRVVGKNSKGFHKLYNVANFEPRKGDHIVWKKESYIVLYVEYDFDDAIMYIVVENN